VRHRLECLDGLRGLLAMYVLISHMADFLAVPDLFKRPFAHGEAAVDLFFILSGMVIVSSLQRFRCDARLFLRARAIRTLPAFLAVFAIAVPIQPLPTALPWMPWVAADDPGRVVWSTGWPQHWAAEIAAHLTMTHGLFPEMLLPGAWISFLGSAWSLSTEWQFYAIAAALAPSLKSRGLDALAFLFLGLAALGLAWQEMCPQLWQFSKAFLPNKAAYFALGIASASMTTPTARRCIQYGIVLAATLGVCFVQGGICKLAAPAIWSVCLAAQCAPTVPGLAPLHRCLRASPLIVLGAWSYAIYLVNEPIQKVLALGLARLAHGDALVFTWLWLPTALLLPLTAAWLLHRWIERPAMRAHVLGSRAFMVSAG
jgi:peptidoglycan/LPS O-acetylase OafA/YrhL